MTQKIIPSLWFNKNCQEAIDFYTSLFKDSKISMVQRYPEGIPNPPWGEGMDGKIITAIFELESQKFMALDGGPHFKFTPAVSLFVTCPTAEETIALFNKLSEGGTVLMPLQEYPFSKMYGWCNDKYGLSWQVNTGEAQQKITPSFMFKGENFGKCEEAINFYVSVFKDAKVNMMSRYENGEGDEEGKIKYASFQLEGFQFNAMESSHDHKFDPTGAISFDIECKDQAEVDYYWEKLTQGGDPKAQQCGWLQDKYGFSWQIIPEIMGQLLSDPDKEKSNRVMQAMLEMKKIDIAGLKAAYQG